jgi:hypothetical protein
LDEPQHLYNANVLVEIWKGNEAIKTFFNIDNIIVGYWSGHFFLGFFLLLFPAWLAEKMLFISYIAAMAFSFRYLVRSANKENDTMAVLIFPFTFSMYFMMGYYSFSIAFIPFFLIFGYLIRNPEIKLKNAAILALLFLFSFFSHAFVFALTGFTICIYFFIELIFKKVRKEKANFKELFQRILLIGASAVPSIIFFVIYMSNVMHIDSTVVSDKHTTKELVYFLFRIRQLVAYSHENEAVGLFPIFIVLMLSISSILIYFSTLKNKERINAIFSNRNIWFGIALVFLILYFIIPNRISAGSLTNRIGLLFFYTFITALAMNKIHKIIMVLSLFILFFSFLYLQNLRTKENRILNAIVEDIKTVEDQIKENSTIYSVRASDLWLDLHFGCYLGTDKAIINLNSPQNAGQFPIVWNYKHLPQVNIGEKQIDFNRPKSQPLSVNMDTIMVDYIAVYHNKPNFLLSEELKENIDQFYKLIYKSPKNYVDLYQYSGNSN